ncbi:hypothetical protein J2Z83_000495 [Virgibacillus natechei]|uniref:DUF3219 family protein n=1 Tax=Virgibacillus natechei TaxID=1216297 RepID=A0ABS4IBU2_9BACI|nr:DUF3219 family protein [Virgibacillus natechei]MBP1968403.1 hypothetical protein [Virgibacillus natechei]UZD13528.1 YkvR family protein [Virgibacillus natechei]
MNQKVIINDLAINAMNYQEETVTEEGKDLFKIGFDFKVTSSDYHDVTTLLYKNDFTVKVPGRNINLYATIYNYSTSITNLYEEDAVGDFKLELMEKV